ncbi:hypothetical protein PR048_005414, partial [Dryococelus australis]
MGALYISVQEDMAIAVWCQYMPSKSGKYKTNFFRMCESDSGYSIDSAEFGFNVMKLLIVSIHNTSRNTTTHNCFISNITGKKNSKMVGTLRQNKRDVPNELKYCKNQHLCTTKFAFKDDLTIVSLIPRKNKCMLLLSPMHHVSCIDEKHPKKKPEIIKMQHPTHHQEVKHQRRLFIKDLSEEIILLHMNKRAANPFLQKYIRQDMEKFI